MVDCYNSQNFANCPLQLIEDALRSIHDWELEKLNEDAMPLANLGVLVAAIAGAENPDRYRDSINPYGLLLKKRRAVELIDPAVAKLTLELNTKGVIPSWARGAIDWELLRLAAED